MKGGSLWAVVLLWLVAASSAAADPASFTHDANGNLTSRTEGGVEWAYAYDSRDQLREVRRDGTIVEAYQYDAQGRRVRKTGADGIVRYAWDGDRIVAETDDFGNTIARYRYSGARIVSVEHITEGTGIYVLDALGSPVGLVRADGTLAARYGLDAWGVLRAEEGAYPNPFRFTGHQFDEATGLYYAKARYYDPGLGTFLTEDPHAGSPTVPPSLHHYSYAYQNPTVFHDPTGRIPALVDLVAKMSATEEDIAEAAGEIGIAEAALYIAALRSARAAVSGANALADLTVASHASNTSLGRESEQAIGENAERIRAAIDSGVRIVQEDPGGGVRMALAAPSRLAAREIELINQAASGDPRAEAELLARGLGVSASVVAPALAASRAQRISHATDVAGPLRHEVAAARRVTPTDLVGGLTVEEHEAIRQFVGPPVTRTPVGRRSGLFEVDQTGAFNYRIRGGGTQFDIDGWEGRTIIEMKFVDNPERSPYVPGSKAPDFLRVEVEEKLRGEFERLAKILADPAVPFRAVAVRTNADGARTLFESLMREYNVPGRVEVVGTALTRDR